MKGERRHELEKNELADWITSWAEKIKPYQNAILGVVLLLAVGIGVYTFVNRQSQSETQAAWDQLYAAIGAGRTNPAEFESIATEHAGTITAHWALLLAGEVHLARGCDELFASKATGRDELKKAEEDFLRVLEECRVDELRERATFGLAQVQEAAGNLDEAIADKSSPSRKEPDLGYQGVINLWPEGTYAALAKKRLKDLKRRPTREFYDEFARWEPKSPVAGEPGTPGVTPPTDLTPPDQPLHTPLDPTGSGATGKPSGLPEVDLGEKPAPDATPEEKPAPKP